MVGCFFTFALIVFPVIPVMMCLGLGCLVTLPFVKLLSWSGLNIETEDLLFIKPTNSKIINSLLNIMLPIWAPFYYTYYYIANSKLLN